MANTVKCLKVVPLGQVSVVSLEVTCVSFLDLHRKAHSICHMAKDTHKHPGKPYGKHTAQ